MPNRGNVLVIDDDRSMLEIASAVLRGAGYRVRVAEDAMQGFRQARQGSPDVIVLDIRMPGGGGEQVWNRLKACSGTQAIPVVVITGAAPGSPQAAFLSQAQVSLLQKPVEPEALVAAVDAGMPSPAHRPLRKVRR